MPQFVIFSASSAIARIGGLLLTGGLNEPVAPANVGGFGGLADTRRSE